MWWMDENEDSNGSSWLKEPENTEEDKKKFFAALEKEGIQPDFSDDEADDQGLLDSIADLNSQIDKLQTPYESIQGEAGAIISGASDKIETSSIQDQVQHNDEVTGPSERQIDEQEWSGQSFIEENISSVIEDAVLDSPKYTTNLQRKDFLELSDLENETQDMRQEKDDLVIPVNETLQLKPDLKQHNVVGDVESVESQNLPVIHLSFQDSDNDQQDSDNDQEAKNLEVKKENVAISFASFEESTLLLDNEYNEQEMNLYSKEQDNESLKGDKNDGLVLKEQKTQAPNKFALEEIESLKTIEPSQEIDATSQKSNNSKKEIKVDKEELLKFQSTINDLEYQVKELEHDLYRKEKENDTLKKESFLLESILEKEQANSKRLLSRMGGNNQADLSQLKKEVEDQERLIHGYQLENEKLIDQNKDLKMQLKESEKKEHLKSEKLSREITAIKTQLSERERFQTRSELGVATYQLQIETMEQELQSLKTSSLETSEYQKAEIEKLKAMLKEANKSKLKPDAAENSMVISSKEFLEMKDNYDAQIIELEQKLKWHIENQEMIDDLKKSIAMKDARIKNLEDSSDLNSSSKKDPRRRSLVDIQKINSLEAEIKKLKDPGNKSRSNISLKAEKPMQEKTDNVISLLEAKISTLNEENEQLSRDAQVRITNLQQEYNGLRIQYEKNMEEMEKKLQDFENNDDEELNTKINQLEIALEEKDTHLKQLSESNVRKRVMELELLLDEQSNIYMALLKEKSVLKEQMIKITREREKLIDSYEAQVDGMEKALRDKIFAVEETKHLDELNDLKLKREADQREILDLKTRLEISEKTRSSVQETTLVILKQSQEDSAKIAMAHHERSLKSILNEFRAETGNKSRQEEERELSEAILTIEKLEKINFDLECNNAALSDQVKSLSAQVASLQEANSNLESILNDSKSAWPPSQQKFEGLKDRIRELEAASNKREGDIVSLLEESRLEASQEAAQEKRDLLKILNRKDSEIINFKQELESLMGMMIRLKNEKY